MKSRKLDKPTNQRLKCCSMEST